MIIAVDLDEVLCALLDAFLTFYNGKNGTAHTEAEFHSYDFWETLGGTKEEFVTLLDEFGETEQFRNVAPFEEALPAIRELAETHTLVLVTARPEKLKRPTEEWLARHLPGIFARVHMTNQFERLGYWRSKADVCREERVDVIIEDNREYATECAAAGVRVLLLDKPWNQGRLPERITRVRTWEEILALTRRAA